MRTYSCANGNREMDEKDRHIVTFDDDGIEGEGFTMHPSEPVQQETLSFGSGASDPAEHTEPLVDTTVEAEAAPVGPAASTDTATPAEPIASFEPADPSTPKHDITDYSTPSHAMPPQGKKSTKKKKEPKYVTKGALVLCMIITMIVSSAIGAVAGRMIPGSSGSRAERNDSELSELNLSDATGSKMTVSEIISKNADAVVEIVVEGTTQGMWGQLQLTQGAGSGVIIKDNGYIATNYHVIDGANKVEVTLHNGETYSAKIVGADQENDIAVIKIDAKDLTTASIGDSSKVNVGDLAVAIGNPLGQLGGTATSGIISALDRTLTVEGTTLTLLQTDAAINGGNSGGGLFNSKGELIGIVESKASAVGVEGLAFALPINSVSGIINDMIENGGSSSNASKGTPAVGVVISEVSEQNAQYYGLEAAGVYVAQVTGSNAQKAGFKEKDRIVSFNGKEITSSNEFITLVRKCKIGDTVTVVVSRDGQEIEIKTELEELQTNE